MVLKGKYMRPPISGGRDWLAHAGYKIGDVVTFNYYEDEDSFKERRYYFDGQQVDMLPSSRAKFEASSAGIRFKYANEPKYKGINKL